MKKRITSEPQRGWQVYEVTEGGKTWWQLRYSGLTFAEFRSKREALRSRDEKRAKDRARAERTERLVEE